VGKLKVEKCERGLKAESRVEKKGNKNKENSEITSLLSYFPTSLLSYFPTFLLSYFPTFLLSYFPTFLLSHFLQLPLQSLKLRKCHPYHLIHVVVAVGGEAADKTDIS